MKTSMIQKTAMLLIACVLAFIVCGSSLAEEYSAQTMRLMHYEGNVEILDAGGQPRFVMENVRFASGEAMRTGAESYASVSLDAAKIVTMDQQSLVEFTKENSRIVLKLRDGSLMLDVQKKLDDNETLDIETSTMGVGIRGTIVIVSDHPLDQESGFIQATDAGIQNETVVGNASGSEYGRASTLIVLEGVATVTYQDTDGITHTILVIAGEKVVLISRLGNGRADEAVKTREISREDLGNYAVKAIEDDPALKERVDNASNVLIPDRPLQIVITHTTTPDPTGSAGANRP